MVLLTMTPAIVDGLGQIDPLTESLESLREGAVGKPISHSQIIDLAKALKVKNAPEYNLEALLRGSSIYKAPPPSKPEPSDEYKALMARLRREEEERAYERMINRPPPSETFSQQYPSMAQSFAAVNKSGREFDLGDDDVTYNDVHRQLMLILNFMLSILGTAGTLWVVARWWSTPARLLLTLGGSLLVGIAEIAVYSGYIWHLGEAKKKDKSVKETKHIVQTWVVDRDTGKGNDPVPIDTTTKDSVASTERLRRRKKDAS